MDTKGEEKCRGDKREVGQVRLGTRGPVILEELKADVLKGTARGREGKGKEKKRRYERWKGKAREGKGNEGCRGKGDR